jgi:hypothetical protein
VQLGDIEWPDQEEAITTLPSAWLEGDRCFTEH